MAQLAVYRNREEAEVDATYLAKINYDHVFDIVSGFGNTSFVIACFTRDGQFVGYLGSDSTVVANLDAKYY